MGPAAAEAEGHCLATITAGSIIGPQGNPLVPASWREFPTRPQSPVICPHLPRQPRMQAREGGHRGVVNVASIISIGRQVAASADSCVPGPGQASA